MKKFFFGVFTGLVLGLSIYAIFFESHDPVQPTQDLTCAPDHENNKDSDLPVADQKSEVVDVAAIPVSEPEPEALPLEPPPDYDPSMPDEFKTQPPGEFHIKWVNQTPGLRTRVFIYGPDGKELKTNSSKGSQLYIKSIPYTDPSKEKLVYSVRMATANEEKVFGKKSIARELFIYREHFEELIMPEHDEADLERSLASAPGPSPVQGDGEKKVEERVEKTVEPKKYMAPKILKVIVED